MNTGPKLVDKKTAIKFLSEPYIFYRYNTQDKKDIYFGIRNSNHEMFIKTVSNDEVDKTLQKLNKKLCEFLETFVFVEEQETDLP